MKLFLLLSIILTLQITRVYSDICWGRCNPKVPQIPLNGSTSTANVTRKMTTMFLEVTFPVVPTTKIIGGFRILFAACSGICNQVLVSGGIGFTSITVRLTSTKASLSYIANAYQRLPTTLTSGEIESDDQLLSFETYNKIAHANKVVVINISFPRKGTTSEATINYFSVTDVLGNDKTGIKLKSGGVGFTYLTIQVEGKKSQGVELDIHITGQTYTSENWPWMVDFGALADLVAGYDDYDSGDIVIEIETSPLYCSCKSGFPLY